MALAALLLAALLVTACDGETSSKGESHTQTHTRPITTTARVTTPKRAIPKRGRAPYVKRDPADFPKMASHLAFDFGDGRKDARFALNVVRGCNPSVADRSFALNPKQVNFIMPGRLRRGSACGAEDGFAVTYGNGYWTDSSRIVSQYRGIGTIRPFRPSRDFARYKDGARAFSDEAGVLNMFSSGTRNSTAEWAARLKAHWTLTDLGGSLAKHRGVHGVWGDNFIWWNDLFDHARSPGGKPLKGTAAGWDNGLVRNHQKLRSLLGPKFLLGGNGAGWACSGYTPYYGTIPGGACAAADAAMWEDAGRSIYDAAAWDRFIRYFDGWIKAGAAERRQKYGIMAEFGTCNWSGLGHPLTSTDERLGLAMATIGGIDLWAVHDCDWRTTVVPGGQFSIPEMGDNSSYPRGWLGQPTSDPVRVALGEWKRTFTGGTVYANLTNAIWEVDSISVPTRNAIFVKN
jgi:hypothetical protein